MIRPTYQTRFGEDGNCTQACIATIMGGWAIGSLPHIEAGDDANGWIILERYMQEMANIEFQHVPREWMRGLRPIGHHIIGGLSPRDNLHAVVGYMGLMVFDPHPEGGGLVRIDDWTLLVPAAPTDTHKRVGP